MAKKVGLSETCYEIAGGIKTIGDDDDIRCDMRSHGLVCLGQAVTAGYPTAGLSLILILNLLQISKWAVQSLDLLEWAC